MPRRYAAIRTDQETADSIDRLGQRIKYLNSKDNDRASPEEPKRQWAS